MKIKLNSVASRWVLSGEPGPALDDMVAQIVGAGVGVEVDVPRRSYRLTGSSQMLAALAAELAPTGMTLAPDVAPTDGATVSVAPRPATNTENHSLAVHGDAGAHAVVRAIDRNMAAAAGGASRWIVTGGRQQLLNWLRSLHEYPEIDQTGAVEWMLKPDGRSPT